MPYYTDMMFTVSRCKTVLRVVYTQMEVLLW